MTRKAGDYSKSSGGNGRQEHLPELLVVSRSGGVTALALAGDLDLGTVAGVQTTLEEEVARTPPRLVLDVSALEFIDSSGIHALVQTAQALATRGGTFEITSVPEHIRRLLEITGVLALLTEPQRDPADVASMAEDGIAFQLD